MEYDNDLCRIVQLRGLGWSQKDIAKEVGLSQKSVSYRLNLLEEISKKDGTQIFWEVIAVLAVRGLSEKNRTLEGLF